MRIFRFPRVVFRNRMLDFVLGFGAMMMAAVSAYLPWYIYTHQADFGPPELQFTGNANLEGALETASARTPLFKDIDQSRFGIDPTVTGSINPVGSDDPLSEARNDDAGRSGLKKPLKLPRQSATLQLVFAANGRGLVREGEDLLPVAVGSRLPDGSVVSSLSIKNGDWRLVTNDNLVLVLKK